MSHGAGNVIRKSGGGEPSGDGSKSAGGGFDLGRFQFPMHVLGEIVIFGAGFYLLQSRISILEADNAKLKQAVGQLQQNMQQIVGMIQQGGVPQPGLSIPHKKRHKRKSKKEQPPETDDERSTNEDEIVPDDEVKKELANDD